MTAYRDLSPEARQELTRKSMLHKRVRRVHGKAAEQRCVRCPAQAKDWAQVHTEDGTDIWADYVPLCRSCHIRYDYDARWNPDSLARWRETAGAAIASAWTPQRRLAQSAVARETRRRHPTRFDPETGRDRWG